MLKKIFVSFTALLFLLISSSLISNEKASAEEFIMGVTRYDDFIPGNSEYYVPGPNSWLFPTRHGSSTDLYLSIKSHSGVDGEYIAYLQRAVGSDWVTVAHAGYSRNGTKPVTFTREYNNSYLYPTTPYRIKIINNSSFGIFIDALYAY